MIHPLSLLILRMSCLVVIMVTLSSCSLMSEKELAPPPPLTSTPASLKGSVDQQIAGRNGGENRFSAPPIVNPGSISLKSLESSVLFPPDESAVISLSVDGLPLPAFINQIFANELKLDFQMAPDVANKEDLVTLRVTDPRNRQGIFELAQQVLANYGVSIVQQGDLLRFVLSNSQGAATEAPLIVTGTALPSVPSTHRPIFLIRGLKVISSADAYSMLSMIFEGQGLKIQRDNDRNAVTLRGSPDLVQSATEVLNMLDRPKMKGRFSLRVDPLYTDAESLSKRLIATMSAQGFDIGGVDNNITLVPIKELNALFVFAPDQLGIALVRQWTEQLDKVVQQSSSNDGFYWYQVRNTGAAQLADTLNAVLTGSGSAPASNSSRGLGNEQAAEASTNIAPSASGAKVSGSFVVDTSRNMLLYRGEASKWQEIVPLIKELDQSPSQVLVEVIIAEVSRTDGFDLGATWNWADPGVSPSSVSMPRGGKSIDLNSGDAGGFLWQSLNSSGSTRLAINALANNKSLNVLQTPKVLVRSGESAMVSVADEIQIPTGVVSSGQASEGSSIPLTQFKTRSTGIILHVTPTVFSDGRIDMKVSQEVSNAVGDNSTTITSRNIETSLILNDGGSVLLAGLIGKSYNKENNRVPILGDLPIVGHLFRRDTKKADTTELMVLIVPYLIKDHAQAEALTQSFRKQLTLSDGVK